MIGERTGETYRLGDRVEVKLVEAAPVAGALRFELVSEGRLAGRGEPAQGRPARTHTPPHDAAPRVQRRDASSRGPEGAGMDSGWTSQRFQAGRRAGLAGRAARRSWAAARLAARGGCSAAS